jgi:thiamine biosynthesis protein ThiI
MTEHDSLILLRLGEIFLKRGNRGAFIRALLQNARRLLADVPGTHVAANHMRVLVHHPAEQQRACLTRLERLFGVTSMSPARWLPSDMEAIAAAAIGCARAFPAGASFKVETWRRDKSFPLTSVEISSRIGGEVARATGLRVDVRNPDRLLRIEVESEHSFVAGEIRPGPGGLPVGTSSRVGLLLSGGIDSPVAGWSAMRRGCQLRAIYFHSFPYTGDRTREKVLELARQLAGWHGPIEVTVVPFTQVQLALRAHVERRRDLAVLLYRRMMMRAAGLIAERSGARALITGDNLGQVASQTLENLAVVDAASPLPVLRPLLTFDKLEIVARAQAIGTYQTSVLPYEDCCALFTPKHPATRASTAIVERAEMGLDLAGMAASLADQAEKVMVAP